MKLRKLLAVGMAAALAASVISVSAAEGTVLFVYGGTSVGEGDAAMQKHLEDMGFTVEMVEASASSTDMANGKAMVYVGESVAADAVGTKFSSVDVPVMMGEPGLFDEMLMGDYNQTEGYEGTHTVVKADHPAAGGLSGEYKAFSTTAAPGWIYNYADTAEIIVEDQEGNAAVCLYDEGVAMIDGSTAPARRASFYIRGQDAANATAETWQVFDGVVNWLTGSTDEAPVESSEAPAESSTAPAESSETPATSQAESSAATSSPNTGDAGIATVLAVCGLSAAALVVLAKKNSK
ncbi:MAG TPA: hypothetical protein H9671_06675 [Firmicutes bacterium]|nr:hypothetical protein [Bacillota bacterium]